MLFFGSAPLSTPPVESVMFNTLYLVLWVLFFLLLFKIRNYHLNHSYQNKSNVPPTFDSPLRVLRNNNIVQVFLIVSFTLFLLSIIVNLLYNGISRGGAILTSYFYLICAISLYLVFRKKQHWNNLLIAAIVVLAVTAFVSSSADIFKLLHDDMLYSSTGSLVLMIILFIGVMSEILIAYFICRGIKNRVIGTVLLSGCLVLNAFSLLLPLHIYDFILNNSAIFEIVAIGIAGILTLCLLFVLYKNRKSSDGYLALLLMLLYKDRYVEEKYFRFVSLLSLVWFSVLTPFYAAFNYLSKMSIDEAGMSFFLITGYLINSYLFVFVYGKQFAVKSHESYRAIKPGIASLILCCLAIFLAGVGFCYQQHLLTR